jgi:hypothetical protein
MKNRISPPTNQGQTDADKVLCTAFEGYRCIGAGSLQEVARKLKALENGLEHKPILIFNDLTGGLVEVDLRGTVDEVAERLSKSGNSVAGLPEAQLKRGPGRPKLGVIAREVTLLPHQWDWLDSQPGGASAAVRRLVYAARRTSEGQDQARQSQEAVYRVMTAMAGNFPGFEEALRSFYRRDQRRFSEIIAPWPEDVRDYVKKLAAKVSQESPALQNSDGHAKT